MLPLYLYTEKKRAVIEQTGKKSKNFNANTKTRTDCNNNAGDVGSLGRGLWEDCAYIKLRDRQGLTLPLVPVTQTQKLGWIILTPRGLLVLWAGVKAGICAL